MKKCNRVCILANIGAGKTSTIRGIGEINPNVIGIPEPVEKFKYLGDFYKEPKKYALLHQWNVIETRTDASKNANEEENKVIVTDGHVLTDRFGFVETLFEEGNMEWNDKAEYEKRFSSLFPNWPEEDEYFVYLRCSPEVCLERAKKRARTEEIGLPLSYLRKLHKNFEKFTQKDEMRNKLLIVDVTKKTLSDVVQGLNKVVENIRKGDFSDFVMV